jgi:hypothetical protein
MVTPGMDDKVNIVKANDKFALVIEPDFTVSNSIKNFLILKGYKVFVAHSIKEIRVRISLLKSNKICPQLILLCPHCAGVTDTSITSYLVRIFPSSKIIHTSKPDTACLFGTPHFNIKKELAHSNNIPKLSDFKKEMKNAERREEVQRVLRQKTMDMVEESKRAKETIKSKELVSMSKIAGPEAFDEMIINTFEMTKSYRKIAWDNIKWKAEFFGYKIDFSYIRKLWETHKKKNVDFSI